MGTKKIAKAFLASIIALTAICQIVHGYEFQPEPKIHYGEPDTRYFIRYDYYERPHLCAVYDEIFTVAQ